MIMSSFAGHISFPGGRIDPTDSTPLAAALRETEEEIGVPAAHVNVAGEFTDLHTHFGTLVICFLGILEARHAPTKIGSPREVEEIMEVPVESLRYPGKHMPQPAPRYVATAYESRTIDQPHATDRQLHYWTLRAADRTQPTVLWGLTGEIVSRLLRTGYQWTPPSPSRLVSRIEELQP